MTTTTGTTPTLEWVAMRFDASGPNPIAFGEFTTSDEAVQEIGFLGADVRWALLARRIGPQQYRIAKSVEVELDGLEVRDVETPTDG